MRNQIRARALTPPRQEMRSAAGRRHSTAPAERSKLGCSGTRAAIGEAKRGKAMVGNRILLCAAVAGMAVALAGCEPTGVYPSGGYVAPVVSYGYGYGYPYYGGGYYGGYGGGGYYGGYGGYGYRTGYYGGGVYRGGAYRRAGYGGGGRYYGGGYHGGYRGGAYHGGGYRGGSFHGGGAFRR
jgi:hypothetical protein